MPRRGLLLLVAAFALRVVGVLTDHRMIWPDEVFQTLEPAHRVVFGYGFASWEFTEGTRSWVGPALLMPPMYLAQVVGIASGSGLILLTRLWVAALATTSVVAAGYLATRLTQPSSADPASASWTAAGWLAAGLVAFSPLTLTYDVHPFLDTLCAPLVIAGFALLESRRPVLVASAGGLVALAVGLRPQVVVLLVGLLVLALVRHGRGTAIRCSVGALAGLAVWGAVDWVTWGTPIASALRNLQFNVVQGGAQHWGSSPWSFYLTTFAGTQGVVFGLAVAVGLLLALRPRRTALAGIQYLVVAAVYVAALMAVGHKELRFLLPAAPLLLTVAAVGLAAAGAPRLTAVRLSPVRTSAVRLGNAAATVVVAAAALVGWVQVQHVDAVTLGGTTEDRQAGVTAAGVTAALSAAGQLPRTCGVAVVGYPLTWSGGFTALQRDVPVVSVDREGASTVTTPPDDVNTAVAPSGAVLPDGWTVIWRTAIPGAAGSDDDVVVAQSTSGCAPPPASYTTRWPAPLTPR